MNSARPLSNHKHSAQFHLSVDLYERDLSGCLQEWSQGELGLYLSESSKKEEVASSNKQQKTFNAILTALTRFSTFSAWSFFSSACFLYWDNSLSLSFFLSYTDCSSFVSSALAASRAIWASWFIAFSSPSSSLWAQIALSRLFNWLGQVRRSSFSCSSKPS